VKRVTQVRLRSLETKKIGVSNVKEIRARKGPQGGISIHCRGVNIKVELERYTPEGILSLE